jgi:hypothetical protein
MPAVLQSTGHQQINWWLSPLPVGGVRMPRCWRGRWLDLKGQIPAEAIGGDVSTSQRIVTDDSPPVERSVFDRDDIVREEICRPRRGRLKRGAC